MLKDKNPKLWEIIIKEFDTKNSIGHIAYKHNVKRSAVENAWKNEFGVTKIQKRENELFKIIECPVCHIEGNKEFISRHIMNSKDLKHKEFIDIQDIKIKEIYKNIEDKDLDPYQISYNLFCSPSYIRKIFSTFNNYGKRNKNKRSLDTTEQYRDGRRQRPNGFCKGWKLSRSNGGKRFLNKEKINKIYELYDTDITQKEISKLLKCNEETVNKYLIRKFGKEKVAHRNREARIKKISKIDIDMKINLRWHFFKRSTKLEITKDLNVSTGTVLGYYRKVFSEKLRKDRIKQIQKNSILKSLRVCGKNGITGSLPERLCLELLQNKIPYNITHHDLDLIPPYEVDITISKLKLAISWDGPFHRKPIFGEKQLEKTKIRDKTKINLLQKIGWKVMVIEDDDSKVNNANINRTVGYIIRNIDSNFNLLIIKN